MIVHGAMNEWSFIPIQSYFYWYINLKAYQITYGYGGQYLTLDSFALYLFLYVTFYTISQEYISNYIFDVKIVS
jgi:hypothetical protein